MNDEKIEETRQEIKDLILAMSDDQIAQLLASGFPFAS